MMKFFFVTHIDAHKNAHIDVILIQLFQLHCEAPSFDELLPVSLFTQIILQVLRHVSHLPVLPHFRDRSPCTVCDFVVNGLRKTCSRYCIQFAVFYDRDKTSGYLFTFFVLGDFLLRWRQKEYTMMISCFLLVMMRRKKEPLLNQNGNLLVLFSTK